MIPINSDADTNISIRANIKRRDAVFHISIFVQNF